MNATRKIQGTQGESMNCDKKGLNIPPCILTIFLHHSNFNRMNKLFLHWEKNLFIINKFQVNPRVNQNF